MSGSVDEKDRAGKSPSACEPCRPTLGTMGVVAVVCWIAVLAAESLSWRLYAQPPSGLCWLNALGKGFAAALPAALLALRFRCKLRVALRGLVPALLGAACAFVCSMLFWQAWQVDVGLAESLASERGTVAIELVSDPVTRDYGIVSEGRVVIGHGHSVAVRLKWPADSVPLSAGHAVKVAGSFKVPSDDEGGRWNHRQGFVGMVLATHVEDAQTASGLRGWVCGLRDGASRSIAQLGGDKAALLAGIVVGDKTLYASTELEQAFRTTGLAHLMAVSGTHLAVVTLLLTWVMRRLRIGHWPRLLLLALSTGLYVALTCFSASALRAYAMCLVASGSSLFSRRAHPLTGLAICVVLFLSTEPSLAFSLGFELSVLCMVGLLVFSPLVAAWLQMCVPRRMARYADGVAATLAANLVTLPVTVPLFCQLPLVSPLSALAASPLVTLALALGIPGVLLSQVLPLLGEPLLALAGMPSGICAWLVRFLADVPGACIPLDDSASWLGAAFALAGALLWAVWPLPHLPIGPARSRRYLAHARIAVCAAALLPVLAVVLTELGGLAGGANLLVPGIAKSDAQVVMLDVGQGDAMLVRDGDAAVLVDTGEEGTVLLKALARHGVTRLDAVLLSHKDADHTGALSALSGVVSVRHVYVHEELLGSSACAGVTEAAGWVTGGRGAQGVAVGSKVRVGHFTFELLSPEHGGQSENDDSLIWMLTYADNDGRVCAKGLLTGDAEEAAIAPVIAEAGDIDFLKVGHHGSRDAVSDEEMHALKPELALISVGADNTYGHPTQQTLDVLERGGAKVLRTDQCGDITLGFSDAVMGVKTQRQ